MENVDKQRTIFTYDCEEIKRKNVCEQCSLSAEPPLGLEEKPHLIETKMCLKESDFNETKFVVCKFLKFATYSIIPMKHSPIG